MPKKGSKYEHLSKEGAVKERKKKLCACVCVCVYIYSYDKLIRWFANCEMNQKHSNMQLEGWMNWCNVIYVQPPRRQWVRPLGAGRGPWEPQVVHSGRAGEQPMGHVGRGRDAAAGGVHQDRHHQRAPVVRRGQVWVLRVFLHPLRHRVHLVPLCGDQEVARHKEPGMRQPGPHLQELQLASPWVWISRLNL